MKSVVVLGAFAMDMTMVIPSLPGPGETVQALSYRLSPGGKGSNQATASARAGARTAILALLGDDPEHALSLWRGAGVDVSQVRRVSGPTGAAVILLDQKTSENSIAVCPQAACAMTVDDIDHWADCITNAGIFIAQLETPLGATVAALRLAALGGAQTVLNPAPAPRSPLTSDVLRLCTVITPNQTEAEALTGIPVRDREDAARAATRLIALGANAVVITLGADGALLADGPEILHVPAFSCGPLVDTTGAGDAFNGAFAAALLDGATLSRAVREGCAAAGLAVTRHGAAHAMPSRVEIDRVLRGEPCSQ